jgi:hypothetical protein
MKQRHLLAIRDMMRGVGILAIIIALAGVGYLPSTRQARETPGMWLHPHIYFLLGGILLQVGALFVPYADPRPQRSWPRRIGGWLLIYLGALAIGTGGILPGLVMLAIGILLVRRKAVSTGESAAPTSAESSASPLSEKDPPDGDQ